MPPGVDWFIWRLVSSPKLHGVTWESVHTSMSFDDLVAGHDLLDALEFAEALARRTQGKG